MARLWGVFFSQVGLPEFNSTTCVWGGVVRRQLPNAPNDLVTFSDLPRQTQPGRPSWNNSYDGMVFSAKHLSEKVCYRINMGFSDIFKT